MNFFRIIFSTNPTLFSDISFSALTLAVLFFWMGQSAGYTQNDSLKAKGIKSFVYSRTINADKEQTWKMISDVSNYHKIAPNIDSVEVISGEGKGMIRKCTHKADSWTEVSTFWKEGEKYSFKVNTDAADYPYPLKHLHGTWQVKEVSQNETEITMQFDFAYKRKIHDLLLHPFMKSRFNKISEELLDNWQRKLEAE